ncbi:MAG: hypothetical protein ACD_62C00268G0003 [uncultured bacterium]|nr:MAG: hypothetical protein ACD_62C00268G0003 [uncultured bacterium]
MPIQRERHTNWPVIQASGVKGAFRAHCRNAEQKLKNLESKDSVVSVFGSESNEGNGKDTQSSSVAFSDAKILAFPVRSNIAPFVWVTSPAILKRFQTDLEFLGLPTADQIPVIQDSRAIPVQIQQEPELVLEDFVAPIDNQSHPLTFVTDRFKELSERFFIVSDQTFDHMVSNCTEIQTQIKIDESTGTTSDGSLRYQELLPSATVLYVVSYYSQTKQHSAQEVKNYLNQSISGFIQIGGDETLGRGLCKLSWFDGGAQ